jgi:hypothetical protein
MVSGSSSKPADRGPIVRAKEQQMAEPSIVGGEGEVIDIDSLKATAGADPDVDEAVEPAPASPKPEPANQAVTEQSQSVEQSQDEDEAPVPRKAFNRLYAEKKELERQLASRPRPTPVAPQAAPAPKPDSNSAVAFLQGAIQPIVDRAVAPLAAREAVNDAKGVLSDFWAANPEFVEHREALDKIVIEAVKDGNKIDEINPVIILDALLGQARRTSVKARQHLARATTDKQEKINVAGKTNVVGNRATPIQNAGKKKFSEMSTAEIEAEWGKDVIWRKGLRHDEDE